MDYPFVNDQVDKKRLSTIVNDLAERYSKVQVAASLDALKEYGFHWATRSGITVAISDVVTPPRKLEILEGYEEKATKVQTQYERGLITDDERRQELIEIWTQATNEIAKEMEANIPRTNTIYRMVSSGARGNWMQLRQIAGMRGLVSNPKGDIIPRPIRANFREGLSVLEFFISTHGSRKGLADTALRTADSGYLTRRLVDVSQDVIIREDDCGTDRGLPMPIAAIDERTGTRTVHDDVETSVYARTLAEDVVKDGEVLAEAGIDLGDVVIGALFAAGVDSVKIRSVLTCDSKVGTCALCYGRSLATGKLVDIGEAVGIIAAQSIGEPGTQLTMRTFHTGGVAGDDITQGLPRVVELFEARTPKGVAPIAEASGRITIEETDKARRILLTPDDGSEEHAYPVTKRARLLVQDGQHVEVGTRLTVGNIDPKNVLRILGPRQTQMHLVDEVQNVYRQQGVSIHDKHIEVIVRQMLRRITIIESGDADLLPGHARRARPLRGREPSRRGRGRQARLRSSRAHGHHQGLARDRVVAVGGVVPGDHPRAHRGRDGGQVRLPPRASRRTSSSASSSRPARVCPATATSRWSRPRRPRPRCTPCRATTTTPTPPSGPARVRPSASTTASWGSTASDGCGPSHDGRVRRWATTGHPPVGVRGRVGACEHRAGCRSRTGPPAAVPPCGREP